MTDDKKTLKFQMMMSPNEAEVLDDWMFKNRVRSRAEAIRRLTQIALALEPFVYDLHRLWEDVQSADASIGGRLLDAWANIDTVPVEDTLRAINEASEKLVPAALELGAHASMMSEMFDAIKSGENVENSVNKMKARIREREGVRAFIRKSWGTKKPD